MLHTTTAVPSYSYPPAETSCCVSNCRCRVPSVQEQMGTDPISKLAKAIEKLADAMREGVRE